MKQPGAERNRLEGFMLKLSKTDYSVSKFLGTRPATDPGAISEEARPFFWSLAPRRYIYSTSVVDLGSDVLALQFPLVVAVEEFRTEVVASWPEVEAWGSGSTDAEAINALKDAIADLYFELKQTPDANLGKTPLRWKRALVSAIRETATN